MDSLFDLEPTNAYEPLPVRMRPTKLDHLYGQEKAVGKGDLLTCYGREGYHTIYAFLWALWNGENYTSRYHC